MTNKLNELKQIRDNAPFDAEFVDADVHEDGNRILTRSLEDINARIELMEQVEQLQQDKERMLSIIKSVAHIGVDFGYGKYEMEQEFIDMARAICEQEDI